MAGTSALDVREFHVRSDLQERHKGTNIQDCSGKAFKGSVRWSLRGRTSRHSSLGAVFINGSVMQQDYYSVLASVIMASARDNAQLRRMIYELARSKLRQQLALETEELSHFGKGAAITGARDCYRANRSRSREKYSSPHIFWNEYRRSCHPLVH